MRAGKLSHRVVIEKSSTSRDEYGSPVLSWSMHVNRWAQITPKAMTESAEDGRPVSGTEYEIRTRHVPDATSAMRIIEGDAIYDVLSVYNVDADDRETVFSCSRQDVNNGT